MTSPRIFRTYRHIQLTLTTGLPIDANDESLQRYKQSLGLGGGKDLSDPNDPRVCIIQSLTMDSPGRPPATIDLSQPGSEATLKDKPFKIKEGVKFTMSATFRVQHEILSGLQYVQVVKRSGIRVSKDSEMLVGCYKPRAERLGSCSDECYRAATLPTLTSNPSTPRSVSRAFYLGHENRQGLTFSSPRRGRSLRHARSSTLHCGVQLRGRRQENPSQVRVVF